MRFKRLRENRATGWAPWNRVGPELTIQCCDCALVHDIEFRMNEDGHAEMRLKQNPIETRKARKWNK